jgi:hypothetical protein
MKGSYSSLIALTVGCTVAATIFGFGSEVFSYRSIYDGSGREGLIQISRLFVFVALGVLLAFRGGWIGVLAAMVMVTAATTAEWALFPFAYAWASIDDPAGYVEKFGGVERPSYTSWATYDILGVGISAALSQGLRVVAHYDPREL